MPVLLHKPAADSWTLQQTELALRLVSLEVVVKVSAVGWASGGTTAHLEELFHLGVFRNARGRSNNRRHGTIVLRAHNIEAKTSGWPLTLDLRHSSLTHRFILRHTEHVLTFMLLLILFTIEGVKTSETWRFLLWGLATSCLLILLINFVRLLWRFFYFIVNIIKRVLEAISNLIWNHRHRDVALNDLECGK